MSRAPESGERRISAAQLRTYFQQFVEELSTDAAIAQQFAAWADARQQWCANWSNRAAQSSELILLLLVPGRSSSSGTPWTHPIADDAPELDGWRIRMDAAAPRDRDRLVAAFVTSVASIESDRASAAAACVQLARMAGERGVPFAAFTPALNAVDPARFAAVCDAWIVMLRQYDGGQMPMDIGAYPQINEAVFRWMAAAAGESPAFPANQYPVSDCFGIFCHWVVRRGLGFDVTQRKYKDWPPMW